MTPADGDVARRLIREVSVTAKETAAQYLHETAKGESRVLKARVGRYALIS